MGAVPVDLGAFRGDHLRPGHRDGHDPDVVLVRVTGRQMMVLSDAIPGLNIEGKPQCHIVAIAKEDGMPRPASGARSAASAPGMSPTEMTCAIPASKLAEIVESVQRTRAPTTPSPVTPPNATPVLARYLLAAS